MKVKDLGLLLMLAALFAISCAASKPAPEKKKQITIVTGRESCLGCHTETETAKSWPAISSYPFIPDIASPSGSHQSLRFVTGAFFIFPHLALRQTAGNK